MAELSNTRIKEIIRKYALQNAVKYKKTPQAGAVMGKVMGEHPELRSHAQEITLLISEVLDDINRTDPNLWEKMLHESAPELLEKLKEKKEPDKGLQELERDDGVVMRFAPNPNGPPTIGSARGIIVNSEYVKRYHGKFIIRFDDTDPQTKKPLLEAYDWYIEDCIWLDAKPDEIVIASDRIPVYYDYAARLIQKEGAYVCFCEQAGFKKLKDAKIECPHRSHSIDENMKYWQDMLTGAYDEQKAVLRIKTDIAHKDPAIRDWVAFRIIKATHPRVGDKYVAWPMLDFESAIEDHLLGTTHIIRGKDLADSESRQKYIYKYMGWVYPRVHHWGRVRIHEFGKLSTSGLKKAIAEGIYTGWDDPRVPTVRALRRRGILPQAIRKFMIDLGVGLTDIAISLDTLYAENRKLIDPVANRYFFVQDPVEVMIEGAQPKTAKPPIHPEKGGYRELYVEDRVLISSTDAVALNAGDKLRLKDLYNIEILSTEPFRARYIGESLDMVKKEKARIIHWLPPDGIPVRVLSPDGILTGLGEQGIRNESDRVVQFERFGFVRIDSVDEEIVAYFTHK